MEEHDNNSKSKITFNSMCFAYHLIGVILSIVFLFVKDPGFYNVWIWMVGSLVINAVLLFNVIIHRGD